MAFPWERTRVWLPVRGRSESFMTIIDHKPVYHEKPVATGIIYVVASTMVLNKRPPASTFTAQYQPGTPITDQFKQSRS